MEDRKRDVGCCRKSRNGFEIEVSRFLLDEAGCSEKIVKGVAWLMKFFTRAGIVMNTVCFGKVMPDKMNKAYGYQIKRVNSFAEMGMAGREEKLAESRHIRWHYPDLRKLRQTVPSAEVQPASCRRSMHIAVSAGESWKSFAFLIHNRHELNANIWK